MNNEILIYETKFWKVILSNNQYYLGRSIIILKRDCEKLSNLTYDEWKDFYENIIKKLENSLKKSFNATMFNWTCLMNDAYKSKNPKPQIHWHFWPRYNHKVEFFGEKFCDCDFGHHYNKKRKKILSNEILKKISDEIKKNL